ncbi:MAG: HigA family addiction module antidote protein [Bacteroidales bacterium]|nr:HigA family addiction module antidote protein [Candidatus Liminaster caballi]
MITLSGIDPNMIANNLHPAQPTHPGEIIKDEIDYLRISQKELSEKTGISYTIINEIIHSKRQVSVEYAMLLEAALNLDADMLINMQHNYNKEMALRNKSFMERLKSIRRIAASVAL